MRQPQPETMKCPPIDKLTELEQRLRAAERTIQTLTAKLDAVTEAAREGFTVADSINQYGARPITRYNDVLYYRYR